MGQELVIGGYIPGAHGVDAIVVGYYRGQDLIYVAPRTLNAPDGRITVQLLGLPSHLTKPTSPPACAVRSTPVLLLLANPIRRSTSIRTISRGPFANVLLGPLQGSGEWHGPVRAGSAV